ncbi:MAG: hypothetical protein JNJ98_19010 [Gemmatimonadetes bacterium]|nr:hypothetical protein [Gemmatimonadota bacterium]
MRFALSLVLLPVFAPGAQEKNDGDFRRAYAKAFVEHRAGPSGVIPPTAMFEQYRQFIGMPHAAFTGADLAWRSVGPAGLLMPQDVFDRVYAGELKSGRVNTVSFHPTDSRTLLLGSQGGIWRTTDAGHTWAPTTDNSCTISMGAVAFDPVNPNLAYALTGDARGEVQTGCGVLRSSDGGRSWTVPESNPLVGSNGYELAVDRATAGSSSGTRLLAATDRGLFLSVNSGGTWNTVLPGRVTAVVQHPTNPTTYYAARQQQSAFPITGVYRSTDGGQNWSLLPSSFSNTGAPYRITLAVSRAAPTRLWAYVGHLAQRSFTGIFRWEEATQQWAQLPGVGINTRAEDYPFTIGEQQEYDQALGVDPRDANRIWIGGVGAFFSSDGGQTFQSTARNIHVDWHHISFNPRDPDHMVAGTDGGFYTSYDGGRSWRAFNRGLAISQIYPGMSVHPSGQWLFAGLQDNSAIYFTGSPVWNNLSSLGDGGYTAINPATAQTIFVTHSFANFVMRRRGSAKEELAMNGIAGNDRAGQPRPIVMSPSTPTTLYFGTQRLYRTLNEGDSWTDLTGDATRGSGIITTIAVSPSHPQVIYAGTSDGVIIVSLDAGVSWRQFVFAVGRRFSKIIVDPLDPLHAIATATTFGAPKLTETRDGGQTFNAALSSGLTDIPVHTALFVPGTTTVMIGTDFGVLQSATGGGNWTQGPPGLPIGIVYELTWAQRTGTVFAATHGRGAWAFRPGTTTPVRRGDVDSDGRLTAQDALVIQQAIIGVHPSSSENLFPNGDANCDGQLTSVDAMLVLRASVGLSTTGTCAGTLARPISEPPPRPEPGVLRILAGKA